MTDHQNHQRQPVQVHLHHQNHHHLANPRLLVELSVPSSDDEESDSHHREGDSSQDDDESGGDGRGETGTRGGGDSSGTGTGSGEQDNTSSSCDGEYAEVQKMARKETDRIRVCRLVVLVTILVTGFVVAAATFCFLSNQEQRSYEDGYVVFTRTVEESTRFYARNIFDAMRDMSEMITLAGTKKLEMMRSNTTITYTTFPFVTVEYFESRVQHTREQTKFQAVIWIPLVERGQIDDWVNYSVANIGWLDDSREILLSTTRAKVGINVDDEDDIDGVGMEFTRGDYKTTPVQRFVHEMEWDDNGTTFECVPVSYDLNGVIWQTSPPPLDMSFVNEEMLHKPYMLSAYEAIKVAREGVMSGYVDFSKMPNTHFAAGDAHLNFHRQFAHNLTSDAAAYQLPHSAFVQPVFQNFSNSSSKIVGLIHGSIAWDQYLLGLLPDGVSGMYCVLKDTCGSVFTYKLTGRKATYLGKGDLHETDYDDTEFVIPYSDFLYNNTQYVPGHCMYTLTAYSSLEYEESSTTNTPLVFTIAVAAIFLIVALTFFTYDTFVSQRNKKVISAAARANSILASLFPKNVRDRLYREKEEAEKLKHSYVAPKSHLNSFLNNKEFERAAEDDIVHSDKPIADLFPATTILFGDIAGFTAWSSVREPAQVFILLETVYHAFDIIAKRRRIFKVETVGDCYVAVTGLPDPRKDHAVAMCRFARDCLYKFRKLTKQLEVTLGPDTGDLEMRMGLNSGPVTAGVLRGDRSRFQLFGDTMNTASRMESTGLRGKIQVSEDTAALLRQAGKERWLTPREDTVIAKGKGELSTYWLSLGVERSHSMGSGTMDTTSTNTDSEVASSHHASDIDQEEKVLEEAADKMGRLVDWNVEVLLRILKCVVARRNASARTGTPARDEPIEEDAITDAGERTLDEVCEIINLPTFDAEAASKQEDVMDINLPPQVVEQLYRYVASIARTYNENPFHNFEHASHVAMSVNKLLARIVAPDLEYSEDDVTKNVEAMHDHTYGITSDPLTQFAVVYSALIHDVDHQGVPNAQLVKEGAEVSEYYHGRSVAEQNSVDLAWRILMEDGYRDLRRTIYTTRDEFRRFRQLVVNAVMATDIADKDLKDLRNGRWAKAFSEDGSVDGDDPRDAVNRKATIVIEHLIQASDIAHTMQHWHIYRKWNERFFLECHKAFSEGRADKDPAEFWYKGEIGFYDFYIIPLAKKLKDCGVFGVSSDEYLNYALRNRQEWEQKGREVVNEMIEEANSREWSSRAAAKKKKKQTKDKNGKEKVPPSQGIDGDLGNKPNVTTATSA